MAKRHSTLLAEPLCVSTFLLDTRYTSVGCDEWHQMIPASLENGAAVVFKEGSLPTNPPATAVVADELLCQLLVLYFEQAT